MMVYLHGRRISAVPAGLLVLMVMAMRPVQAAPQDQLFRSTIAPLITQRCLGCHRTGKSEGDLNLERRQGWLTGGESGPAIVPGAPDESLLLDYISGDDPEMPKQGEALSKETVEQIRTWIREGARWPDNLVLRDDPLDWWSLRPLVRPPVPAVREPDRAWAANPIDAFVLERLRASGLVPSPRADRRTLIRRLYYDLIGLPPSPERVDAFVADERPDAYERLVDELLASPRYGERWARHWLDVVHFGETHGYDKDKPRPHAWHYRDYVIRSFNRDKPYARFVMEQLAGDVLDPGNPEAFLATGFIAAGPWDFIGHVELPDTKLDGKIARNLDRDDMVTNTLNTFASLTVQCARCHDHKFDPIRQQDYYALQAVFAAVDRVDRPFDPDPHVAARRRELQLRQQKLAAQQSAIESELAKLSDGRWQEVIRWRERRNVAAKERQVAFGYHSKIEARDDVEKWVQVDLGRPATLHQVTLYPCHDDFNQIGDGFGFPVRWKLIVSPTSNVDADGIVVADYTSEDYANPGCIPIHVKFAPQSIQIVRIVATKLARRANDFNFALAELALWDADGANVALGARVSARDSIEAPPRWRATNLTDGSYYGQTDSQWHAWQQAWERRAAALRQTSESSPEWAQWREVAARLARVERELAALPPQQMAYVGAAFRGKGNFKGTGGIPRPIHVLARGDVRQPLELVQPGVPPLVPGVGGTFALPQHAPEGERRLALARWLTREDHPLTWRSIVNRVWLYHFGQGIVETPNDFGRMGGLPSHPELLDWLAVWFRDNGQSLKALHRLIVTSATYQQSSALRPDAMAKDAGNRLLWRANRRRLEAEAVRDSLLQFAGRLDLKMYGPSYQDFVIERPEHSPHYEYGKYDPRNPECHRRAVYRFIVRSQPQPMMQVLDCADPSMSVPRRQETTTPQQALVLLNNELSLWVAEQMAARVERRARSCEAQVRLATRIALQRAPTREELEILVGYAKRYGLPATCRVLLNLNEVMYVD